MMKIRHAEDFGVAFNVLAREYRRTASRELLALMNRTCDRYLQYFSLRTLSCAIRDLQPVFALFPEPTPMEDEADYEKLLKRLLQYYIAREAREKNPRKDLDLILHDLALQGQLTQDKFGEMARFKDEADFVRYVQCNNLLEAPLIENPVDDELPIEADFYKDFAAIVQYLQNYAEGRLSYMPQLARDFLCANAELVEEAKQAVD